MSNTRARAGSALAALGLAWLGLAPAAAEEDETRFQGAYAGASAGLQSIIAGALVDDVDMLAQETRPTAGLDAGMRARFGHWVLGAEAGVGVEDGDLSLEDPGRGLRIDYANAVHWRYGLTLGRVLGAGQSMLYAYAFETKRSFDVTVSGPAGVFTQEDGQGLLHLGLGYERAAGPRSAWRLSAGVARPDFGGRALNEAPEAAAEAAVGLVVEF